MRNPGRLLALFLVLLVPIALAMAGRIKGRVIDKSTQEPLVGANIAVEGTTYGSVADAQGEFTIFNIPVGVYTLRAAYVGYETLRLENVRVNYDLTTEVTVELTGGELALQVITIVAERPLVTKNSTNAVRITTSEDIKNIPLRGLDNIIALEPGVVYQDGQIHIRGGRVDETGFYLEGVSIADPQYGGRGLTLVQESMEEVMIQSSGYEAEFGRANSGIVQHQLRTGGTSWNASLDYATDNISFWGKDQRYSGEKRLGTYWYGYNEFTGTVGGPVFSEKFRFFGLFNYNYRGDKSPQAYPGISIGTLVDPTGGDTINYVYPAGAVLKNSLESYSGQGTFTSTFGSLRLRLSGSYTGTKTFSGSWPLDIFNLDRIPVTDIQDGFGSLKATYFFTPSIFAEVSGGFFKYYSVTSDPVFGDNLLAYGDSVANAEAGYTWIRRHGEYGRYTLPTSPNAYSWYFTPYGYPTAGYLKLQRDNITLTGAFSAVLGKNHTIKLGGDYQRYTIRTYEIWPGNLAGVIASNDALPEGSPAKQTLEQLYINYGVNNYGYDVFGNLTNSNDFLGPRHPVFASAYVQDKMEYSDLVVNLGLRYDYISTHSTPVANPLYPDTTVDYYTKAINPSGLAESPPYHELSPRLGVAFPVSDRTVFHVQYAKMVQQSRLRDVNLGMYSVANIMINSSGGHPIGFNLKPTKTIQYEIGFQQQLGDFASFDITGYYKDIKDEITMTLVKPARGSLFSSYPVYVNGDYATTKGVELKFMMRRVKRVTLNANISFQEAQGSGSYPNSNRGIVLSMPDTVFVPLYIAPLAYNQAVRGNLNLDYRFGPGDGGPVLQELGASCLFFFGSGHPYTRITSSVNEYNALGRIPAEPLNSSRTPWTFQVDLRVDKTFRIIEPLSATLYVYVINLLDRQNVANVHFASGSPTDDGWLSDPQGGGRYLKLYGPTYGEMYRQTLPYFSPVVGTANGTPYFFGEPRQVRLGLKLEF